MSVDKNVAIAACRAAAWTAKKEPLWEPAAVVDGEQLYRRITPKGDRMLHCYLGGFGADWNLESVEELIGQAKEITWSKSIFNHNLRVVANDKTYRFEVDGPVK